MYSDNTNNIRQRFTAQLQVFRLKDSVGLYILMYMVRRQLACYQQIAPQAETTI
jgi:hypothetical protein